MELVALKDSQKIPVAKLHSNTSAEATTSKSKSRYQKYLNSNANLRRWYNSIGKKSEERASVYLRSLCRFCKNYVKKDPRDFAKLSVRRMEDLTMNFVDEMEKKINPRTNEPYAPGYIESYVKAIASWARWNDKKFVRSIPISNINYRPKAMKERVPTQEEMRNVLYSAETSLRTRVVISGIGFSGPRFMSFGDKHGRDGLKIKDLLELKITTDENGKQKEVIFEKIPTYVKIRPNLSKTRKPYLTLASEEECEIWKQWLDQRIAEGEVLGPETGIVVTTKEYMERLKIPPSKLGVKDDSPFLTPRKISCLVRDAMRASGLPWRPYIFRSYFDSALMTAEQKGWITHSIQQFIMGHSGDIESVYTTSKERLPDAMLEEIREAYKKASKLLQTRITSGEILTEEKAKNMMKVNLFTSLGFTEQEIATQKLLEKNEEEIQTIVKSRISNSGNTMEKSEVYISPDQADALRKEGYCWAGNMPDGRIVMRR